MEITKALIIDEPWITKALNGEKDWEMRSSGAKHRGLFGLIRKGSGQVVGIANLTNVSGPYDNEQLAVHKHHHHVGPEIYQDPSYKWRYAWELSDVKRLMDPVPYQHKKGAVTWVELNPEATEEIAKQLTGESFDRAEIQVDKSFAEKAVKYTKPAQTPIGELAKQSNKETISNEGLILVPVAKDGSLFSPDTCNNSGIYTVGDKGDERKFRSFHEALDYLKSMSVARWRRSNANGNYGIVAAVDWVEMEG